MSESGSEGLPMVGGSERIASFCRRFGALLIVVLASFIGLTLLTFFASHLVYWLVRQFFIAEGARELPFLNPHFIRAGAAFLTLALGAIFLTSRKGHRRILPSVFHFRWIVATAVVYIGWNLTLGIAKQDQLFDHAGKAATHWSARPDGSIYIAHRPGYDPVTGAELAEITPDAAVAIWHWKEGPPRRVEGEPEQFIHPVTGSPMIWVGREEKGSPSFYDGPGFDPASGEILVPADREWLTRYREKRAEAKAVEEERLREEQLEKARVAAEDSERARQESIRVLINANSLDTDEEIPQVTVSIAPSDQQKNTSHLAELAIVKMLEERYPKVRFVAGFFKPEFFESPIGRKLLSDGWKGETGVSELRIASAHLVFEISGEEASLRGNEKLVQSQLSLAYSIYDRDGGLAGSGQTSGNGAAFSRQEATLAAIERTLNSEGEPMFAILSKFIPD